MARLVRHQPLSLRRALIAVALLLELPATAGATTVKKYEPKPHTRCRTHYVKRVVTVKEHKHGKVIKVKQTWCVYVAPKTTAPTTTATTSAPALPASAPTLAVTLDPSYVQDPANPLTVTYTYSASATINGSPDSSLPAGVLSLYSDGLLACSINVGGSTTGGTCTVTYAAYGAHTVDTTYDSGTNSATTGTETVTIAAPPPATPPTFQNVPASITTPATSAAGATVTFTPPTATDADGNPVAVSCSTPSGSTVAIGRITDTCSATDQWGNTAQVPFTITVDSQTPVLAFSSWETAAAGYGGLAPLPSEISFPWQSTGPNDVEIGAAATGSVSGNTIYGTVTCTVTPTPPLDPNGSCLIYFSEPGVYTLTLSFTSSDQGYGSVANGPSLEIDVTS